MTVVQGLDTTETQYMALHCSSSLSHRISKLAFTGFNSHSRHNTKRITAVLLWHGIRCRYHICFLIRVHISLVEQLLWAQDAHQLKRAKEYKRIFLCRGGRGQMSGNSCGLCQQSPLKVGCSKC